MAEDYEMVKDDNSHEEGRNVGMDELQFDSVLSSEPENLSINPDPLESLVASSGEEYPSSFENDFVFHPEVTTGSVNFNLEDTLDLELTDPLVDAEIDKLLDINDIPAISEISNLESDDSFFIPGDSAPDDGIDFSELDNSLTEEPDAFSFGEEDLEESDQNEVPYQEDDSLGDEEGPIALSETELGEIVPAVEDDLPDFISTSVDSESGEENIAESMLGGISGEADTFLDEEDVPIALSGDELDNILNTSTAASDDDLPDFITHVENEDFSLPVEQESNLLSSDEISSSSLFGDSEEEEKISLPEHELEEIVSPVLSEEDSLSFEDFELPTNDFESSITEEDANEPIALSDEELGNLLSSENEEPITSEEPSDLAESIDWDSPTSEPSEISLEEEDSNEPIALSLDELDHILTDENEEPITSEEPSDLAESIDWDSPTSEPSEISLEEEDANEPIALSDEELGNLLASENEELTISEESNDLSEAIDWDSSPTSEISLEDEEANEPIALSGEELGNLLASENEELTTSEESNDLTEAIDWDSPGSETSLEDEEANEPIALSDEELGNLLASENEELTTSEESNDLAEAIDWDSSPTSEVPLEDEEANEPIALSLDELDHILTDENEEPAATSQESSNLADWDSPPGSETSLEDEEANEPIALSLDELDYILTDENEEPAAISEESNDLAEAIDWDSPGSETSLEDEEANEPIALSLDELDHILTDENEEPAAISEESNDLAETIDWDSSPASEISLEDEEANEPIAFSDEELGNLLASGNEESEDKIGSDIPKVETEEDLSEILGELPPVSDLDAFDSIDEDVSKEEEVSTIVPTLESVKDQEMIIVLDEYADEEESSPIEELRKTPDQTEAIVGELSGDVPSKDEMKRIMTYLDELLGNLPDDLIREFSRSDYFELYKKLMKQIGV
ncbi:hypothetical protein [Leptospira interrogans]|uniref:hypothetical protein n=1 Tax=Leptospira interrogans TaxID=173 RepID=UPI0004A375CC|nr:hypothetical protein [Leptospira interrogans]